MGRGGNTFIDEVSEIPNPAPEDPADIQSSGSSVAEEDQDDGIIQWSDQNEESHSGSEEDVVSANDFFDEEDFGVEGEDWDLADGDFTKHYNRMRQHHTASTSASTPLPARNLNSTTQRPHLGVSLNPKVAGHDKDKSDRATQDQVLDARTRAVLSSLANRGVIGKLERCISTGKEANVYLSGDRAVKIYRTSILNFRSRKDYIQGEHRFRGEYTSSKNPRKMVRVWAEKELRNLRRLRQGGVRAPEVFECKENVLVMEYLGAESAAPRLKDTEVNEACYREVVELMRRMYQDCRLVHADLSEYNVLLYRDHPWIIDVSQSVEHDHPHSLEFLRMDIGNVNRFFEQRGVEVLSLKQMWDYVTTAVVQPLQDIAPDDSDDAVFMASFIPKSLNDVYDPERDVGQVNAGKGEDLIYAGLMGLKDLLPRLDLGGAERQSTAIQWGTNHQQAATEDTVTEDKHVKQNEKAPDQQTGQTSKQLDADDSVLTKQLRGHRHEDRDAKKERKKAVKEEQREKRLHKMSKSEKSRLIKKSSRK